MSRSSVDRGRDGVTFTGISDVSESSVMVACEAVSDALLPGSSMLDKMTRRWRLAQEGQHPDSLWIVCHGGRPAGWAGWVTYPDEPNAWQTTTYLAPQLRGVGLLPVVRCRQIHAMAVVERWSGHPDLTFLTSVDVRNRRSLRASSNYIERQGWPGGWKRARELGGRDAWVYRWPRVPAHSCPL